LRAAVAAGFLVAPMVLGVNAIAAATGTLDARWTFDAGAGSTVADSIGTANGTKVGGSSWLTSGAAVGTGAMHFDGVDGRVDVPTAAALQPNSMTMTAWVRAPADAQPTVGQVIAEKGAFGCDGASYGLYVAANQGFRFTVRAHDGTYVGWVLNQDLSKTTLWDGNWHVIGASVAWFAGDSGGEFGIYMSIDGSPRGGELTGYNGPDLVNGAIGYTGSTSSDLTIGGPVDASCATDYFHGDVDDVRIYSDPFFDIGSLMTPVPTTTTLTGSLTGHPQQYLQFTADVSPAPRWGYIQPELFMNNAWTAWGVGVFPDAQGHVAFEIGAPPVGTYPFRARYVAQAQYGESSDGGNLVITAYPTTTTLAVSPSPTIPTADETLTATVSSDTIPSSLYPLGSVEFYDTTGVTPVLLGSASLNAYAIGVSKAVFHISTLGLGTHKLRAKYVGPDDIRAGSQSSDSTLVVDSSGTFVQLYPLSNGTSIEAHHAFQLEASVGSSLNDWAIGATMTFRKVGVSTPICVVAVDPSQGTRCTVPAQSTLGAVQYTATYSGNADNKGATSSPLDMMIVADTVHATGVGRQYSTFYPYRDGYEDTDAIKGTRGETIGVTIRIYNPSGALIRTVTIGSGTGSYSYSWNGRNSAGTEYAAGAYKITQTLKDSAGTSKTYTNSVYLSHKILYTYSKAIAHYGSSVAAKGTIAPGTISFNTTSHYTVLKTGSGGWAGVGWEFTLPSATIYKSIKFQIYAKGGLGVPPTDIGMQNFKTCPYVASTTWDVSCFDRMVGVGNQGTTAWYTTYGYVTTNRSGNRARGIISDGAGTWYVYKVQVVVTYGILK
jgi:hypothetical protein